MGKQSQQKKDRRIREGRESVRPVDLPWTPLKQTVSVNGDLEIFDGEHYFLIFANSRYTVFRRVIPSTNPGDPDLIHLSIKRNDRKPIGSWRDLQKIKNELVGPECEGVQLFPAESRLVDTSMQYHLWVIADPEFRFPFGYKERLVAEGNSHGAVQEPFEDHVRPGDVVSPERMSEILDEYYAQSKSREEIP